MAVEMLVELARFSLMRNCTWLRQALEHLESFRTPSGTYRFPKCYLQEKEGYYLYAGHHMGLGETPRCELAHEIESTFRIPGLHKRLN